MCYNESEGPEYDIVGCAISNNMAGLNRAVQDQVKKGLYSLAYNPDTKIDEAMVQERLRSLFGIRRTGAYKICGISNARTFMLFRRAKIYI